MERVAGTPYRRAAELEQLGAGPHPRDRRRGWSTPSPPCTRSTRRRRAGATSAARRASWPVRSRRWKKQLDASYSRDLPAADELHARLAADVPAESAAGIVHGDYRLDNVLVDERRPRDRRPRLGDGHARRPAHRPGADAGLPPARRLGSATGSVTDAAPAPRLPQRATRSSRATPSGSDRDLSPASASTSASRRSSSPRSSRASTTATSHGQTVGDGFDQHRRGIHPLLDAGLSALEGEALMDFAVRRQHRGAARPPARVHGQRTSTLPSRSSRAARQLEDRWAWDSAAGARRAPGRGAQAGPVEPVPAGGARRGPDQPAVRAAGRDHGPQRPARPHRD